ncbi:MAG: hypothetical protein K2W85_14570 [Phycisphaerales bacterium]|nr:hypothetical protein [Phycisphaerales bacterium]
MNVLDGCESQLGFGHCKCHLICRVFSSDGFVFWKAYFFGIDSQRHMRRSAEHKEPVGNCLCPEVVATGQCLANSPLANPKHHCQFGSIDLVPLHQIV